MYSCQKCKKRFTPLERKHPKSFLTGFTYIPKSRDEADDSICPQCGSKDIEKAGLLDFFRGILSSGGG